MAVQVWIGEKPENPNERKAIIALASGLERLDGLYVMLANFSVGGRTLDLVILKRDAIFIIELKHCDGKVYGSVNGTWTVVSKGGSVKQLNPGRKNPYGQVNSYFYSFTNFLIDHKQDIVSPQKALDIDFRQAKRLIAIVPTLEEGSEVELDWKVQVKGLDELPTYLVVERCNGMELSDAALERIPKLLHCTPWQEVHDLLKGVMPAWETVPSEPPPPAPEPEPIAVVPVAPPKMVAHRWAPWKWAVGGSVLTAFISLTMFFAFRDLRSEIATDNAAQQAAIAALTPVPTRVIPPSGYAEAVSDGIALVNQPVRKNWDEEQQQWFHTTDTQHKADATVTLETVDYNDGKITLTWVFENNRTIAYLMNLTDTNVSITDGQLQYIIDADQSQPSKGLYVSPGERIKATMVVPKPVRPSAISLNITLLKSPFAKTTWIVPVR